VLRLGLFDGSFHVVLPRDTPERTLAPVRRTRTDAQRSRASSLLVPSTPEAAQAAIGHGADIRPAELLRPGLCETGSTSMPAGIISPRLHPATELRRFSPLFYGSLHRAQFLLDQRCGSCLRFLAGRCAAAHGFRATCIRRAASSGGFLATSFGGLPHFHGSHILMMMPFNCSCRNKN
jgi:hypothetical protein